MRGDYFSPPYPFVYLTWFSCMTLFWPSHTLSLFLPLSISLSLSLPSPVTSSFLTLLYFITTPLLLWDFRSSESVGSGSSLHVCCGSYRTQHNESVHDSLPLWDQWGREEEEWLIKMEHLWDQSSRLSGHGMHVLHVHGHAPWSVRVKYCIYCKNTSIIFNPLNSDDSSHHTSSGILFTRF